MKKICIINHGLANGGTDAFVMSILKNINQNEFSIDLFLAVNENSVKQAREDEAKIYLETLSGKILKISDLGSIIEKIFYPIKLIKALKESGPYDVVHSNMDLFNGINLFCAKIAGVPIRISHSHTSESQYENKTKKHFVVEAYRRFMKKLIDLFSTKKIGCSQSAVNYLYSNKSNTEIIFNGIDLSKYSNTYASPISESQKHKLITVGNLINVKNPYFMIQIIEELSKIRTDFEFYWVGTGDLESEIKETVKSKGLDTYISMLGFRNDVDQLLKQCSVFLMPSLFEGLSFAMIEAQAANLTCIVSDTISDEIDCGKCEFLPLKNGAAYWAEVINEYLNKERVKSLDYTKLNRFNVKNTIKQIEKHYK